MYGKSNGVITHATILKLVTLSETQRRVNNARCDRQRPIALCILPFVFRLFSWQDLEPQQKYTKISRTTPKTKINTLIGHNL